MEPPIIRKATIMDTETVSELGERTFRDAFGADNNPEDLNTYMATAFTAEKIASEMADPAATFLLVFSGETAVGYAKLKTGNVPECVKEPNPMEIERLYVEQGLIGRGVGSALMAGCIAEARLKGCRSVWLGVWEQNIRAISFYRKWGFAEVGDKPYTIGSDVQRDLVLERTVEPLT